MTDLTTPIAVVGGGVIRSTVDTLAQRDYAPGVVALRASLGPSGRWSGTSADGIPITAEPCPSALAMRERLRTRPEGEWLVLVTDRENADLGPGLLTHLVSGRVRSVDVWESVLHQFRATHMAPSLAQIPHAHQVALGLLSAAPPAGGWPAAPGGVLTREHALDATIRERLALDVSALDMRRLIAWSLDDATPGLLDALVRTAGDALTGACLDRVADVAAAAAPAVRPLLTPDQVGSLAARGLVVDVLRDDHRLGADDRVDARVALARAEQWWEKAPSGEALRAFGSLTQDAVSALLTADSPDRPHVVRALDQADGLLSSVGAESLARLSTLLPSAYDARAAALGRALSAYAPGASLSDIEEAWATLGRHRLAGERFDDSHRVFAAAVRLARWVATPVHAEAPAHDSGAALAACARIHLDDAGWVDAAVNTASVGVDAPVAAAGVEDVVALATTRREAQARQFAQALAAATRDDSGSTGTFGDPAARILPIERVLDDVVAPVAAGGAPVLFLLLDGMSAASATTLVEDAVGNRGWQEARVPGSTDSALRAGAITALPSLTTVSRATLFAGRLTSGDQTVEREGFLGFAGQRLKAKAALFHKSAVDDTRRGWALADDVRAAIDDPALLLVGVVLNTIDDALDRSDPGGAIWTADSVKHLAPLLSRAAAAGRTVIVTGDHGHIIERRDGRYLRPGAPISSNRSRAVGADVTDDEVLVQGRRVVTPDNTAVLAVSEQVRYGPIKAGYHGGAHPAEAVVPIIVLHPPSAKVDDAAGLPPQIPRWWIGPIAQEPAAHTPAAPGGRGRRKPVIDAGPSLFDLAPDEPETARSSLGAAIVGSDTYDQQVALNPRVPLQALGVAALIDAFADARGNRLDPVVAAQALGIAQARLRGAQEHAKQLLNVDGYPVLRIDDDGRTLVLDLDLLCEQFGVSRDR